MRLKINLFLSKDFLKFVISETYLFLRNKFPKLHGFLKSKIPYPHSLIVDDSNFKKEFFVNNDKKIVYLAIPKVACTSIKILIYEGDLTKDFAAEGVNNIHRRMASYREISSNAKSYFSFTFVRNPFDRLYSCYLDKCVKTRYFEIINYLDGSLKNVVTFKDFIREIVKIPSMLDDRHFKSQYSLIYNKNKCLVDYIGKFETLSQDYKFIQEKYGLRKLSVSNKSNKKESNLSAVYTRELVDLVFQKYKKDFDCFYPNAYEEIVGQLEKQKETY